MTIADLSELTLADRAMTHLSGVVDLLTAADLDRPTPCADWQVRDVLAHLVGTAAALADYARTGRRELPERLIPLADPIADTQQAIAATRAALAGGSAEPADACRAAGDIAVEFTTHAWDLDPERSLPDGLAAEVLAFVSPLVTAELRTQFFAPAVRVGSGSTASDRLVAFLGRDPRLRP